LMKSRAAQRWWRIVAWQKRISCRANDSPFFDFFGGHIRFIHAPSFRIIHLNSPTWDMSLHVAGTPVYASRSQLMFRFDVHNRNQ
jgi:hypothetical protein